MCGLHSMARMDTMRHDAGQVFWSRLGIREHLLVDLVNLAHAILEEEDGGLRTKAARKA